MNHAPAARLFHFNQQFSDKDLYWKGSDTEALFKQNLKDPAARRRLEEHGWDQSGSIHYRYNSEGFRDEPFDDRPCGLAFGCSFTEGVGVRIEHTWPRRLTERTGLYFWNLGVGGAAVDTIYRFFNHYIDRFRPKAVILCHPPMYRMEYVVNDHVIRTVSPTAPELDSRHPFAPYLKNYFLHDLNSMLNFEKNMRLLEYIAAARGLVFMHAPMIDQDCAARDLMHPGPRSLDRWAEIMADQIKNKY